MTPEDAMIHATEAELFALKKDAGHLSSTPAGIVTTPLTDSEREIASEVGSVRYEEGHNPEFRDCEERLDTMSVDSRMVYDILCERRKDAHGVKRFFKETKPGKIIAGVADVAGTAGAGIALRSALHMVPGAGTIAGEVVGVTIGGAKGWQRAKERVDSANRWQGDAGMGGDIDKMTTADLYKAIGLIYNAANDHRIKGKESEKLSLMFKHRAYLTELDNRADLPEAENDPILSQIAAMKKVVGYDKTIISKMAGEDEGTAAFYKDLSEGKRKEVWAETLKSAAMGGLIAAVLGSLFDHFFHGSPGAEHLAGKEQALQGQHTASLNDQLNRLNEIAQAGGPHTAAQKAFEDKMNALIANGGLNGFHASDIQALDNLVRSGVSMDQLHQFAGLHNIDLGANIGDGHTLGHLVTSEGFVNLPQTIQHAILSYPSLTREIVNNYLYPNADPAGLAVKITAGLSLLAGWLGGKREEKLAKKDLAKAKEEQAKRDSKAREGASSGAAEAEKAEDKKEESLVINHELRFKDPKAIDSEYTLSKKQFIVRGVEDGKLVFEMGDDEKKAQASGKKPFPTVKLEDILKDGELDLVKVTDLGKHEPKTPEEIKAEKEKKEKEIKNFEYWKEEFKKHPFQKAIISKSGLGYNFSIYAEGAVVPIKAEFPKNVTYPEDLLDKIADVHIDKIIDEKGEPKVSFELYKDFGGTRYKYENLYPSDIKNKKIKDDTYDSFLALVATGVPVFFYQPSSGKDFRINSITGTDLNVTSLDGTFTGVIHEADLKKENFFWFTKK